LILSFRLAACLNFAISSVKQAVTYAGLNPRIRRSGQWAGKTPIAKAGNVPLRKALYLPAVSAKRFNPVLVPFCEQLLARGKRPMQVVLAAMRKLLHIAFGGSNPSFHSIPSRYTRSLAIEGRLSYFYHQRQENPEPSRTPMQRLVIAV